MLFSYDYYTMSQEVQFVREMIPIALHQHKIEL